MYDKTTYRDLPKIRDSLSYAYFERGTVEQTATGVEFTNERGRTPIPVAALSTLMLGPGTNVTHAAISTLAKAGCLVLWCGEEGVRFYAQGLGETHKGYSLQRQAELASDPGKRMAVVERMYRARFTDQLPAGLTIEQIRGREGVRVRDAYAKAAKQYDIDWQGRNYDRQQWENSDAVNRALSAANACLSAVCHSAIVSAGYSPGLGFIHQGTQLAFVYDVADLYKVALTVPLAFATAAENPAKIEGLVRRRCRDGFRKLKILLRIVSDIERLLTIDPEAPLPDGFDRDDDAARPTRWWEPDEGSDAILISSDAE